MKRFILGSIVAAGGLLVGYRLMQTRDPAGAPVIRQAETGEADIRAAKLPEPNRERVVDARQAQQRPSTESRRSLPLAADTAAKSEPFAFPRSDDAEGSARLEAQCREWSSLESQRAQAERDAEPRDEAWAHSTAQQLEGFAASHPLRSSFRIVSIDCRTHFCIVQVGGPMPQAQQAFNQVLQDLHEQSRSPFTPALSSNSRIVNGAAILEIRLQRRRNEIEWGSTVALTPMGRKCVDWWSLKAKRREAVLQAESKDASWAYLMEQRLQQFASSHPRGSKFEITSVDCRTTFCEVKATGTTEGGLEALREVMHDARRQPWNTFNLHESASSEPVEGVQRLRFRLTRESVN